MADELTYEQYLQQQIEAYNTAKAGTDEREKAAREIGVLYMSAKDGLFQLNTDHPVTHTQADWERMAQTKVLSTKREEIDTSKTYDHAFVTTQPDHDAAEKAGQIVGKLAKGENIDLTATVPPPPVPERTAAPAVNTDVPERGQDDVSAHPSAPKADEKPAPFKPAPTRPDAAKAEAEAPEVTPEFITKLKELQKQFEAGKGKDSFVGSGGIEGGPEKKATAEQREQVALIQQALKIAGGNLTVDGDWGLESDAAARAVQAKLGLKADGDIGKSGLPKLIEEAEKKLEEQNAKAKAAGKAAEEESKTVAADAKKAQEAKAAETKSTTDLTVTTDQPMSAIQLANKLGVDSDHPTERQALIEEIRKQNNGEFNIAAGKEFKLDSAAYGISETDVTKAKEAGLKVEGKGQEEQGPPTSQKGAEAGPFTPPEKAPREGREDMPEETPAAASATPARVATDKETVKIGALKEEETLASQLEEKGKAMGMSEEKAREFAKAIVDAGDGSRDKIKGGVEVDMDKFVDPSSFAKAADHGVDIAEKGGRA